MKFTPFHDMVLVERREKEKTTAGGLLLPDTGQKVHQRAKVLAVGPGMIDRDGKRIPMQSKVGDVVVLSDRAGMGNHLDGRENKEPKLLVVREAEILGTIEE